MNYSGNEIAIIGIDINFPGSKCLDEFWENLVCSKESICEVPKEDLAKIDANIKYNKNYVNRISVCNGYDEFDAQFFGYSNHEAKTMDPQQRLFLQSCWKALENSGYAPSKINGNIGVYGSAGYNTYLINSILSSPDYIDKQDFYDVLLGNDKDYLSTRVSYKLGLTGPSVTVQTACSSSLVGVHLACQSLLIGESDMCLAGGVCIRIPSKEGYIHQPGFILSEDGHCRAFDKDGSGTVFGSGIGVIVLKRLDEAIEDNDTIYSIIKVSSINNDGNRKIGFTAPSQEGQEDVINNALYLEEIEPESITFIEAHGTGTVLGDPIELKAIINTLGLSSETDNMKYPCAIGSVKSNIGHMDAAAGVAGLIKASLCLYNKTIVPTINFKELNKNVSFDNTRFYIANKCEKINEKEMPIRAAVSALGVGGTNVSIILEEPPKRTLLQNHKHKRYIVKVSAKTEKALSRMIRNVEKLSERTDIGSILYTLNTGREDFDYRAYIVFEKQNDNHIKVIKKSEIERIGNEKKNIFIAEANIENINGWLDVYDDIEVFRNYIDSWVEYINEKGIYTGKDINKINKEYKTDIELTKIWPIIVKASLIEAINEISKSIEIKEYGIYQLCKAYIDGSISKEEMLYRNNCEINSYLNDKVYMSERDILIKNFNSSSIYDVVGSLWQSGVDINWELFFDESEKVKVSAPTYSFEKERYWFNEKKNKSYVWIEKKVVSNYEGEVYKGNYLFLASEEENIDSINQQMKSKGISNVIFDTKLIYMDESLLEKYMDELINKYNLQEITHLRIISIWGCSQEMSAYRYFYVLISLLRYINKTLKKCMYLSVILVNEGCPGKENISKGMISTGIMTTLPKEFPNINVHQIINYDEIEKPVDNRIIREITLKDIVDKVVIHNGKRYTTEFVNNEVVETENILKENGTYVITGGTGNVGLLFAREISKRVNSNIILLSKNYTEEYINNSTIEKFREIKNTISEIRKNGSSIEIINVDISDYCKLEIIINKIIEEYRGIDGVIHAAGKVGKSLSYIDNIEYEDVNEYVEAKVEGAYNLRKIFKDYSLDFCIYISSTVSILGGIGDSIYSGANSVLNYMAELNEDSKYPILSVSFDYMPRVFTDEFVSKDDGQVRNLLDNQLKEDEFSIAFDQIFNNIDKKNIVITNTDFAKRYSKNKNTINNEKNFPILEKKKTLNKRETIEKVRALWFRVLENEIDDQINFFDAGGDSFLAVKLIGYLNDSFDRKFSIKYIYEFSTIELMVNDILEVKNTNTIDSMDYCNNITSVIGMAGRFPGADNVDSLWENLLCQKCNINHFELDESYNALNAEADGVLNKYVGARGKINDVDKFDYEFFGISKFEAELMDPQQRIFLECAWHALEDAGCINLLDKCRVGVFASQGISTYLVNVLLKNHKIKQDYNNVAIINNSPDALATRVSYIFNLTGISKTIQTFCSSSLVALEEAVTNIENGRCDVAIVGGVNIVVPQQTGYIYNEGSIYSNTGVVRPFDDSANGTVFSNGVGVVIIAKKSWAEEEGLQIYSDILGIGINNDGSQKASFLSPSIKGQVECIKESYERAGVEPRQISYIETHGTATNVGDPLEIHALSNAFENFTNKKEYCAIGSIKGNIGHLDRASGITSFIKGCLVADKHCIPPIAYFEKANKNITFKETPFYVNKEKIEIDKSEDMYVGINALGVGGTNVHVVIKNSQKTVVKPSYRKKHILTFSAKCKESLDSYMNEFNKYLANKTEDISNIETTLQIYRKHYKFRNVIVAENINELSDKLFIICSEGGRNNKKVNTVYFDINVSCKSLYKVICDLAKEEFMKEILINEINKIVKYDSINAGDIEKYLLTLGKYGPIIVKKCLKKYISELSSEKIIVIFNDSNKILPNISLDNRSICVKILNKKISNEETLVLAPNDTSDFCNIIAKIWNSGIDIDWNKYNQGNKRVNIHLPGYSFKKTKCWIKEKLY